MAYVCKKSEVKCLKLTYLDIIDVRRKSGDGEPDAEWSVAKRYSEFFQLHSELRAKFSSVKTLEFPRRKMVLKLQRDFLDKRRIALQSYLRVGISISGNN